MHDKISIIQNNNVLQCLPRGSRYLPPRGNNAHRLGQMVWQDNGLWVRCVRKVVMAKNVRKGRENNNDYQRIKSTTKISSWTNNSICTTIQNASRQRQHKPSTTDTIHKRFNTFSSPSNKETRAHHSSPRSK